MITKNSYKKYIVTRTQISEVFLFQDENVNEDQEYVYDQAHEQGWDTVDSKVEYFGIVEI